VIGRDTRRLFNNSELSHQKLSCPATKMNTLESFIHDDVHLPDAKESCDSKNSIKVRIAFRIHRFIESYYSFRGDYLMVCHIVRFPTLSPQDCNDARATSAAAPSAPFLFGLKTPQYCTPLTVTELWNVILSLCWVSYTGRPILFF